VESNTGRKKVKVEGKKGVVEICLSLFAYSFTACLYLLASQGGASGYQNPDATKKKGKTPK